MTRFPKKTDTGKPFLTATLAKGEKGDSPFIGIPSTPVIIVRKNYSSGEYNYDASYTTIHIYKDGIVQSGWTIETAVVNPDIIYTINDGLITVTAITAEDGIMTLKAIKDLHVIYFNIHWITMVDGGVSIPGSPGEKGETGTPGAKGDQGLPGSGVVIKKFPIKVREVITADTTTDGEILHTTAVDHELIAGQNIWYNAISTGRQDVLVTITEIVGSKSFRTDYTYDGEEEAQITDLCNLRNNNDSNAQNLYFPGILPIGVRPIDLQLIRLDSGSYEMYSSCGTALYPTSSYNTYWSSMVIKSGAISDSILNFELSTRYKKMLAYRYNLYLRMTTYPGKKWNEDYNDLAFELCIAYRNYSGIPFEAGEVSVWGDITGVLANQADLQSALNAKANQEDLEALEDTVGSIGAGDVAKEGTPLNGELAMWVSDTTIKGIQHIIWDGFHLLVDGDIDATGDITAYWEPLL